MLTRERSLISHILMREATQVGEVWLQEIACPGMDTRLCGIGMRLQ